MREILFKAKRIDNGEWVEGYVVRKHGLYFIYSIVNSESCRQNNYEIIPETLCQFTGLCDKNGKKIFEGDILKFRSGIYSVEWDNEHSKFLQRDGQFSRELHIWIAKSEIVGNIHDNPELLKGEENE